jgi:hypothetical protein
MSAEPPPTDANGGYNPNDWPNDNPSGTIDTQFLNENYLQFPSAQGAETMGDLIVSGTLTASDATFSDLATFSNGIDIATTAGIKFSDDSVQTVAFIEANYAQLNTDNIFLAPYQNTFAGNASTGNANAPIKLTNGVAGEYATFYLNPSSGEDITLYTNQNPLGGLTIRSANGASFTMNPGTVQDGSGCVFNNPLSMNGNTLSGLNNVYANTGATITIQSPISLGANATATTQTSGNSSTLLATTQFVQDAVQVSGVQVGDSPLAWSGVNTWQLNAGTAGTLPYTYGYGISNLWNLTGGAGDCDIVANAGTSASVDRAYNIYCVPNNITGTALTTTTPQLSLSNNGFPMQVKDGIGIPTGKTYAINGVNILSPYSTTAQMNTAISSALSTSGFAPLASPAFTGTPTISTTPTSGQTTAIADVNYVNNAVSGSIPSLANYAQLTLSSGGFQTFTTPINFTNTLMYNNLTVATTNNLPIYTSTALVFSNDYGTGSNIGTGAGTIYQQAMQQNTSTTAYVNFFSNPIYISIGNVSNMGVAPYLQLAFYTPNLSIPAKPWSNYPPPNTGLVYCFVNTGYITQSWPISFSYINNISYITFYTYSNMGNYTTAYYDLSSLGVFAS